MAKGLTGFRTWRGWANLLLGLVVIGGIWMMEPAMADAQEAAGRTLRVTGMGRIEIPTTLAQINLGVEAQGKTAAQAQTEAARRSDAVVRLVRSRNAQRLETTGIQLYPVYTDRQQVSGYIARNTIEFEIPTEQAGALIDAVVQAGANQVNSISFVASNAAQDQARLQALTAAVEDAQIQANAVLSALKLAAKEITGIRIDGASRPSPMPKMMMAEARIASSPVIGGDQTIQATVSLDIRY
ncbi:MAG: SIMPL domain-containing protein [Gloeomargaritaceae cyanobacterium C42_A2020_066]|nr:SIMPL domain-containing protein [Gloeomargaritaceae cyanobacterium C42_A2020_066]